MEHSSAVKRDTHVSGVTSKPLCEPRSRFWFSYIRFQDTSITPKIVQHVSISDVC